jgi:hypothetical protein
VVDHRAELMRWDPRRQPTQRDLDVTALGHIVAPSTHPAIISNPVAIIG